MSFFSYQRNQPIWLVLWVTIFGIQNQDGCFPNKEPYSLEEFQLNTTVEQMGEEVKSITLYHAKAAGQTPGTYSEPGKLGGIMQPINPNG